VHSNKVHSNNIAEMFHKAQSQEDRRNLLNLQNMYFVLSLQRPYSDYTALCQHLVRTQHPLANGAHMSRDSASSYTQALETVVMQHMRSIMSRQNVVALSVDESTDVSDQAHMTFHIYYSQDYERKHAFVALPAVKGSPDAKNLTSLILKAAQQHLGWGAADLGKRLVAFACDGAAVLQGHLSGVGKRLKAVAPLTSVIHCHAHRADLACKSIADCYITKTATTFVSGVYSFYSHRSQDKQALLDLCRPVGMDRPLKLLRHVETRWVSLCKPMQRVLVMFAALLKHSGDLYTDSHAPGGKPSVNVDVFYNRMVDLRNLLSCAILLPMMQELESLVKAFQCRDMYLPEISNAVEKARRNIKNLYIGNCAFNSPQLLQYRSLRAVCEDDADRDCLLRLSGGNDKKTATVHFPISVDGHQELVEMLARPVKQRGKPYLKPVTKKHMKALCDELQVWCDKPLCYLTCSCFESF
jgi:hypothetical protein